MTIFIFEFDLHNKKIKKNKRIVPIVHYLCVFVCGSNCITLEFFRKKKDFLFLVCLIACCLSFMYWMISMKNIIRTKIKLSTFTHSHKQMNQICRKEEWIFALNKYSKKKDWQNQKVWWSQNTNTPNQTLLQVKGFTAIKVVKFFVSAITLCSKKRKNKNR